MQKKKYMQPEIECVELKLEFGIMNNVVLHSQNEPGYSSGNLSGGGNNGGKGPIYDIGDDILF